jgi:cytoskeletal protein CcmA (bactofilin family)
MLNFFKKENPDFTIIGKDSTFKGEITSSHQVYIKGTVEANKIIAKSVFIEVGGSLTADIECSEVFIAGVYKGNINCSNITIEPTGDVESDITYTSMLNINPNCTYNGTIKKSLNSV